MKRMTSLIMLVAMLSACATTTTIKSRPPGARVYVDEQYLGETPVEFTDSSPFWSKRALVLKKEGYADKSLLLRKDEMRVGPLIGTIVILVPVLWLFGYPDQMAFEMEPSQGR